MRTIRWLVLVFALVACSPEEVAMWQAWRAVDPVAADAHASEVMRLAELGRCGEWHDLALSVGWEPEHWPVLDRVMFAESKCRPKVRNRSGATGLLQVMPMWADECGGEPAQLLDPSFNLACGRYVLAVQGWQAWSTY